MTRKNQIILIAIFGIVFFALSFLFIDKANFDRNELINSVLLNIALIFVTVVVIDSVWNFLGGEPQEKLIKTLNDSVQLLAHTKDSGLVDFSITGGGFANHSEWMKKLISTKKELDLMGYSLRSWTYGENFSEEIIKLAKRGVKIRIMVMDEENPHFETFINPSIAAQSIDGVKNDIASFQNVFAKINGQLKNNKPDFVKVKAGLIASQLCRFDSEICITPYLYSIIPSASPLFVVDGENTGLFGKYLEEFNSLWRANK